VYDVEQDAYFCDFGCRLAFNEASTVEQATFESDSLALAKEVYRYTRRMIQAVRSGATGAVNISDMVKLEALADAVLTWDETDDPIANGWVNDRGLP
jgi:hypothetical protein